MAGWFKRGLGWICHQLMGVNDTPHRKALGLAVGVFLGIFPGTGPVAALVVAFIFKINRAAVLLGALLTNTWISVVIGALAIKVGLFFLKIDGRNVQEVLDFIWDDFHWKKLFDGQILNILNPFLLGFLVMGGLISFCVYVAVRVFLNYRQGRIKSTVKS